MKKYAILLLLPLMGCQMPESEREDLRASLADARAILTTIPQEDVSADNMAEVTKRIAAIETALAVDDDDTGKALLTSLPELLPPPWGSYAALALLAYGVGERIVRKKKVAA